jgi:hypothetical protein
MSGYTQTELEEVHSHLDRLVASPVFAHAERMVRFLRYVVDEVLADRGERLNQTALGIEVFDRNENFDPAVDSLVRVEAGRLRAKLREYYEVEGKGDTVRFELPKGTYQATIHIDPAVRSISSPSQSELNSGSAHSTVKTSTDTTQTTPGKFSIVVLPFRSLTSLVKQHHSKSYHAALPSTTRGGASMPVRWVGSWTSGMCWKAACEGLPVVCGSGWR